MDYDGFKTELMEQLAQKQEWGIRRDQLRFYPDGFTADNDPRLLEFIRNTNIRYHRKESDVLMGDYLVIEEEEAGKAGASSCRFEMKYLYECFQKGAWKPVWENIKANIELGRRLGVESILHHMAEYEAVKERLIVRPINYTDHRYELSDCVYETVGDIALVLYLMVGDDPEAGLMTAKIPRRVFECWGLPQEQVLESAMLNTNIMAPPRIYFKPTECYHAPYERGVFMSVGSGVDHIGRLAVPTITTTKQTNGAIALFYPGVCRRLAQMAGGSFYVAFTSIHEARLHCEGSIAPRSILGLVRDVNKRFDPTEILTRKVYFYDAEKEVFGPVAL